MGLLARLQFLGCVRPGVFRAGEPLNVVERQEAGLLVGPGQERAERQVPPTEGPETVVEAGDDDEARRVAEQLCERLLANTVIERFELAILSNAMLSNAMLSKAMLSNDGLSSGELPVGGAPG